MIAILTFTGQTSERILKAIKTLHHALNEILALHNEISDLRLVLIELQNSQNISDIGARPPALISFDTALQRCLKRIYILFEHVSASIAKVYREQLDGTYRFERLAWLRNKSKVVQMMQELLSARRNLSDLLIATTSSRLMRVELSIDDINGLLQPAVERGRDVDAVQPSESRNNNSPGNVILNISTKPKCGLLCICVCHMRYQIRYPRSVQAFLGRLFAGYMGLPRLWSPCNVRSCT